MINSISSSCKYSTYRSCMIDGECQTLRSSYWLVEHPFTTVQWSVQVAMRSPRWSPPRLQHSWIQDTGTHNPATQLGSFAMASFERRTRKAYRRTAVNVPGDQGYPYQDVNCIGWPALPSLHSPLHMCRSTKQTLVSISLI